MKRKEITKSSSIFEVVFQKEVLMKLIFVIALFISIIYYATRNIGTDRKLKSEGISIKGIVYDVQHVGAKGDIDTYYKFKVGNKSFNNVSIYDGLLNIGDSISIVYLESDPSINRSSSYW
jgi:uncharacterized protein (UPF0333 family)